MLYENEYWRVVWDPKDDYAYVMDSLNDYESGNYITIDMPIPPRCYCTLRKKGRLTDKLAVLDPYATLVLSEKATSVIQKEVRCCPSISWLPMDLLNRRRAKLATYWVLFRSKLHFALDYTRSECRYYKNSEVIAQVTSWVLDGASLPPLDLFRCAELEWLATEKFRQLVQQHDFTGFEFVPAPVWRDC